MKIGRVLRFLALGVMLLAGGCGGVGVERTTLSLIEGLTNVAWLARLDMPRAELYSSYDRTGGNDDFSQFPLGAAVPEGWHLLADLEGPGYISRFWSTGISPEAVRLRFYFDGEAEPRMETTLLDFCAKNAQVPYPVAMGYTNLCYHNYGPIPYAKGLRILASTPGGGKFYYQINASRLGKGEGIRSFCGRYTPEEEAALRRVAAVWGGMGARGGVGLGGRGCGEEAEVRLAAGESRTVLEREGMGVLTEVCVRFRDGFLDRCDTAELLRGLILRFWWDGADFCSAEAPLGDLCGMQWGLTRFCAMCWEAAGDSLFIRYPMPFRLGMRLEVCNRSGTPVACWVSGRVVPLAGWDGGLGYFHTAWRRSGPGAGASHTVVSVHGARGRLAACVLGVIGADARSGYWILESDERIRRDAEKEAGWQGTGLEDYFNYGWYYPFAVTYSLFGVTRKIPFKTSQYRIHLPDAVTFKESLDMRFERGPRDGTAGWMESLAIYYLGEPKKTGGRVPVRGIRPIRQGIDGVTFLHELWTAERFGDAGQERGLLERRGRLLMGGGEGAGREMGLVALRLAALTQGGEELAGTCRAWMGAGEDAVVREAAGHLLYRAEGGYLLHVYTTAANDFFLDGELVGKTGEGAAGCFTFPLAVGSGEHVLGVREYNKAHPCSVYFAISGPGGYLAAGDPGVCRRAYNLGGEGWAAKGYDDSGWEAGSCDAKGPPDDYDVALGLDIFPWVYTAGRTIGFQPERFRGGTAHTRFLFTVP